MEQFKKREYGFTGCSQKKKDEIVFLLLSTYQNRFYDKKEKKPLSRFLKFWMLYLNVISFIWPNRFWTWFLEAKDVWSEILTGKCVDHWNRLRRVTHLSKKWIKNFHFWSYICHRYFVVTLGKCCNKKNING